MKIGNGLCGIAKVPSASHHLALKKMNKTALSTKDRT